MVLVLLGLFLSGYAIVTLKPGVGQIVAGCSLLALSVTAALVPLSPTSSAAPDRATPDPAFTMSVTGQ